MSHVTYERSTSHMNELFIRVNHVTYERVTSRMKAFFTSTSHVTYDIKTYTHTHTHKHAHPRAHPRARTHTHTNTHTPGTFILARLCKLLVHTCTNIHTRTHTQTHTLHTNTHTHQELGCWRDYANCQHCCRAAEDAASAGTISQKVSSTVILYGTLSSKMTFQNFYIGETMQTASTVATPPRMLHLQVQILKSQLYRHFI